MKSSHSSLTHQCFLVSIDHIQPYNFTPTLLCLHLYIPNYFFRTLLNLTYCATTTGKGIGDDPTPLSHSSIELHYQSTIFNSQQFQHFFFTSYCIARGTGRHNKLFTLHISSIKPITAAHTLIPPRLRTS